MIYVNGVRLWLQVSRQRSIKSVYTLSLCLIEQQSKAINRNVHQIAGSCGQADAKRKGTDSRDLRGEAIEEQGCSRGLLDPARLAVVGGKWEA